MLLVDSVKNAKAISEDVQLFHKNGTQYWVRSSLTPIFDNHGDCKNIIWIQEDISDRKLAEAEIASANERTKQILESIHDNFMSISANNLVTYVNSSACEIIGVDVKTMLGNSAWDYCRGSDWIPVRELIANSISGNCTEVGEFLFMGLGIYYEFRVYPTGDGASIFFQDISERKNMLSQLHSQMAQLQETQVELEIRQSELQKANTILHNLATTDGLTGLNNHKAFQEFLENEFQLAKKTGQSLSVVLMDVDKFKIYNDSFGHLAGDDVLKGVAKCMQSIVKAPHLVARYGGEEFVLVLVGLDEIESLAFAEEVRFEIEGKSWPNRPVTASFGVSFFHPETETRQDLVEQADQALYASKEGGRNRVSSYNWIPPKPTKEDLESVA